jgi:hypothetical protein
MSWMLVCWENGYGSWKIVQICGRKFWEGNTWRANRYHHRSAKYSVIHSFGRGLWIRPDYQQYFYKVVGDGTGISFSNDTWVNGSPLSSQFLRLYNLVFDKKITASKVLQMDKEVSRWEEHYEVRQKKCGRN